MIIIANLKNFTLAHDIYVLDGNNNVVTSRKSSIKNIEENIVELCKEHECNQVNLLGNKKYTNKIAENLKNLSLSKYNINLTIKIL